MTDDATPQMILMALPRGRDKARSLSDIAERLHMLRRSVEKGVRALRLEGWFICSCPTGIYLGEAADIDRTISSLQRRVRSQYLTLRALRRARERMVGEQTTLPWTGAAA